LKPGVNPAQAASELSALMRQAAMEDAGTNPTADRMQAIAKLGVELKPASQGTPFSRNQFDLPLKVLMGVVAVVMLIACANIANLLLAKSAARQREIAIRLSLGSTRWRLIRQLLTECAVLAAAGGALGLVFALWARDAIIRGAGVPNAGFEWNYRVFAFTAGVCLLNALLFGIAPALRATGIDFAAALKSSRIGSAVGRLTLGRALVAVQVALSLALVAGAGLFLSTFRNLDSVDLGYARDHALLVTIDPYLAGYRGTRIGEIYDQATQRIAALPGVRSVSTMRDRLMSGYLNMSNVSVPGYTPKRGEDPQNMWTIENLAGPHFFANAGMKLAAGRDFTEQDNQFSQHVAVINESMAQHFFGSENPIGRQFTAGRNTPPLEIVGVVHDIKYFNVQESKMDVFFTPSAQRAQAPLRVTLLVRSWGEPAALAGAVRAAIRGIDPSIPIYDVVTMDEQVRARLALERLLAVLSTFFGALALTLAAVGLYGVLSYGVSQRTSEIGIRMALGAQPRRLLAMILSETATLVIAGAAAGVGVAIGGARLVKQMLYGVTPTDKTTLAAAAGILLLAALVAALLPARRASRVDPMIALRHE
jgi:predicted permease